jgi:hypothetical protein
MKLYNSKFWSCNDQQLPKDERGILEQLTKRETPDFWLKHICVFNVLLIKLTYRIFIYYIKYTIRN